MSKSNSSKMQWPTVAEVAADLHHIREMYCEVPGDVPGDNGCRDTQDDDGVWVDVRLQVLPGGSWQVHSGDSSYDQDHRGFWGAGSVSLDTDCEDLAAGLIDEAKDQAAQAGEDVEDDEDDE
jgi:hypothetical protein